MRNEIKLTDEQIEAAFDSLGSAISVYDLVFTSSTLADFDYDRSLWSDPGYGLMRGTVFGYRYWQVHSAQARKGQTRRDVTVVDFGSIRAAYGIVIPLAGAR